MGNMIQKGFLKLEGVTIQGDSQVKGYEDQIAILDISFGVTQSGKYEKSDSPTRVTNATDVTVRKYMGASSPELAKACAKKTPIDKATIKLEGRLEMTLERCVITSVHPSLNVEDDMPTEVISLSYRKVQWNYQQDDKKGTGDFDLDTL